MIKEYKFPFWKQPKLCDFYFDLADKYMEIELIIYGFDYGKYKVCTIYSNDFKSGNISKFIKKNTRMKVTGFRVLSGKLEIDCF